MPTITIDGQQVNVAPGTTVIQAAEKLGVYIPRYCYHPGLSVAGSCRMCLVEVENMPKLQISCYTQAQDGMKIGTRSEKAIQGRQAMLEFLLINHPLDCPVCDQSGECDLQNFYMEHGRYQSRFMEDKIKRKKAYAIGSHVVLDQERCILCTRCTRFTEEISRTHELGVFSRGNRSVIDLFPGKTLDNPYSGNVIDICPVGALTERQFRFKCRVWYLRQEESICTGCSRGCNIAIHFNPTRRYKAGGRRVQRLKPRFNPEVNSWWMCDYGRFGFEFIDRNRIERPQLGSDHGPQPADWEAALDAAAAAIREAIDEHGPQSVGVIASPQMSNEELFAAYELFHNRLGLTRLALRNPWEEAGPEDELLLKADRNPNAMGGESIGWTEAADALLREAGSGRVQVLFIFRHEFSNAEAIESLNSAAFVIYQGTNWNQTAKTADVVLAGAVHAEKDGTFANFEGRIQRFRQALLPLEDSRADLDILNDLADRLGQPLAFHDAESVFHAWRRMTYSELDEYGMLLTEKSEVGA
ncbi:MAG TPA: molybdopterin-dependent oxidoreductase [Acidobacteriota bacterium]|nr:molybdopterin-dependent oxidoreductase [Acidobacteriota bacterium]